MLRGEAELPSGRKAIKAIEEEYHSAKNSKAAANGKTKTPQKAAAKSKQKTSLLTEVTGHEKRNPSMRPRAWFSIGSMRPRTSRHYTGTVGQNAPELPTTGGVSLYCSG